jgi:hypothetical protein
MTANTHSTPTTTALRQRLGDLVSRWTAPRVAANRPASPSRGGPLTPRRRRLLADPLVSRPHLWAIDHHELRSVLDDSGF